MKVSSEEARRVILEGKAPQGLHVDGSPDLGGCTSLKSLPEGLRVGGYLFLVGCTSLKSLPEGLHVGGWLDLYGCTSLKSLPEGLHVGKNLFLNGCTSLVIDHWDVHVDVVYWDEDVASRVPLEILPLMIAVEWGNGMSEKAYKKRLGGKQSI